MKDDLGRSPLAGRRGTDTVETTGGICGVELREVSQTAAVLVIARRDRTDAASAALATVLGAAPPATPAIVHADDAHVLWSGPGKWLVMLDGTTAIARTAALSAALKDCAAVVDQSDMRVEMACAGPRARDAMAKLVGIDVHPTAFPPGSAAMTGIAHMSCYVWLAAAHEATPETFHILGPRSYAESLWHHAVIAAEEYGLRAVTLSDGDRLENADAAD